MTGVNTATTDRYGHRTDRDPSPWAAPATASLADVLERVLDKGIVIVGDVKIDLLDIELLTIRLRLFISSVETARKAGVDWWETDPALSSTGALHEAERQQLLERVAQLEQLVGESAGA
ncbi:gas vesicle protein [Actinospica robiniae]|uniref:gas vesicle protein n=1 Tax=Actinospica robiniae TaxID=304901 RepID=UPI00040FD229|nr:gas vesicle protein [Actinospica robiniae]